MQNNNNKREELLRESLEKKVNNRDKTGINEINQIRELRKNQDMIQFKVDALKRNAQKAEGEQGRGKPCPLKIDN